ncbi:Protein kinase domain-containing protein ppk32, partial [Massospora cicadina]
MFKTPFNHASLLRTLRGIESERLTWFSLRVTESVEETRLSLTFAAEPLQICLSNLLAHDLSVDTDYQLDALEIQKGLLQLTKALQFCHNDAKLVHGNVTPSALFITPEGDWKLGGFGFCTYLQYSNDETAQVTYFEHDSNLPPSCQQNLDYAAPEFVLDSHRCFEGDLFALGCLIYAVFNSGKALLKTRNNLLTYRNAVARLNTLPLDNTPKPFEALVRKLTARQPSERPSANAIESSPAFDNLLVKTMRFLETLAGHPPEHKVNFFLGLRDILPQFPERLLLKKILPALLEETKATELLPHTLPNIVFITDRLTVLEFSELAAPALRLAYAVKGPPPVLASLLDCLVPLIPKMSVAEFKDHFLPCVYASLESQDSTLQDKALRTIPALVDQLDYAVVKNSLYPRIQALYARTNLLTIKVGVLECFHALLKILDKAIISEKLLPLLQNTRTKEPGVQLAMLAIYQALGLKYLDSEAVACKILPELWKLSINPHFNLTQFQRLMASINLLSQKLQKDLSDKIRASGNLDHPVLQNASVKSPAPLDFKMLVNGSSKEAGSIKTVPPATQLVTKPEANLSNLAFKASSSKASDTVGWEDMFKQEACHNQPSNSVLLPKPQFQNGLHPLQSSQQSPNPTTKIVKPTRPMILRPPETPHPSLAQIGRSSYRCAIGAMEQLMG